jgi:SAM-dependent methyltransferase
MIAEFDDPRLVALYDTVNGYGPGEQPDYYLRCAAEIGARRVVELGCGTGMVSAAFAAAGYDVIGVEPSPAMLAIARARRSSDRVRWVGGGVDALAALGAEFGADFAFMSGHVAQFFVDDAEWAAALVALRRTLRPGGRLAFESRNPLVREWERWTPAHRRVIGDLETWSDVHTVRGGVVDYTNHYVIRSRGEAFESRAQLRFRTRDELDRSLADAGFELERIDGDWDGREATATTREYIVVASRPA